MKKDISNRKDIETLIQLFYEKVMLDPVIGFIFTEVVAIHWEHHIPLIGYSYLIRRSMNYMKGK